MDPKDIEIANPPTDGISCLNFSKRADYLAAASWDNQVRIYEVEPSGNAILRAAYPHEAPVLFCQFSLDGTKLVSGGADNAGRIYDINTGQSFQIAQHIEPIKSIIYLQSQNIVATAGWDKTIQYWDMRSPKAVSGVQLKERLYSMDATTDTENERYLIAATANNMISVIDLRNPTVVMKEDKSPLLHQIRKVSCFAVGLGYAVASIEGRLSIQYIRAQDLRKSFSFKCHRDDLSKSIHSVNDVSFHPKYSNIFSTCSSDGTLNIWDKESRRRLKFYKKVNNTIACTAFNRSGDILAYAVSYDWSKGYKFATTFNTNKIFIHAMEEEVKPGYLKKR